MTLPQRGNTLSSGATFCGDCGTPIKNAEAKPTAVAPSPESMRFRSFSLIAWKLLKAVALNPTEELPTFWYRGRCPVAFLSSLARNHCFSTHAYRQETMTWAFCFQVTVNSMIF